MVESDLKNYEVKVRDAVKTEYAGRVLLYNQSRWNYALSACFYDIVILVKPQIYYYYFANKNVKISWKLLQFLYENFNDETNLKRCTKHLQNFFKCRTNLNHRYKIYF